MKKRMREVGQRGGESGTRYRYMNTAREQREREKVGERKRDGNRGRQRWKGGRVYRKQEEDFKSKSEPGNRVEARKKPWKGEKMKEKTERRPRGVCVTGGDRTERERGRERKRESAKRTLQLKPLPRHSRVFVPPPGYNEKITAFAGIVCIRAGIRAHPRSPRHRA